MNAFDQDPIAGFPVAVPDGHGAVLNDQKRLNALQRTEVMDSLPEEAFDRVVRLATHIIGVPVGLVSFVDGTRQFFKAHKGLPPEVASASQTPLSHSFCQYVVSKDQPLAVADARTHPLLKENLAVPDLGVVAYLGVPVHAPGGEPLGSLCAIDGEARDWNRQDLDVLRDLTAMLETELRLRQERESIQLLANELNHRVKNLFTIVGGMISMTARSADTPSDMAQALQGRLSALSWAHELISPALLKGNVEQVSIELETLVSRLLEPHVTHGTNTVELRLPDIGLNGRAVTDLALVFHELATNAAKYGSLSHPDGTLIVSASIEGDTLIMHWQEVGGPSVDGAPSETGFGSRLIEIAIGSQLGGSLDTEWSHDGVQHTLRLPLGIFSSQRAKSA
ncbi:HWE histidine kinase domain-containing protein [Marivita hallyeonensis]|uniref:histidine kinase n=1 Tax=Marivita hallyeonensis TaxID=996342 RepID=A0A1M5RSX8_9RHOB|nr:HWE histidine kinase domain-containing protein [Marivita hallyeonensis]SHH29259.1 Two-component sensor histidine kinase, contains HisKA and HATPase domains [Marivita hallyeonensis]